MSTATDLFVVAIEAVYAAAAAPSNWPRALQAIADVFGDVGANLLWRRDDGGFGTVVSPALVLLDVEYQSWKGDDIRIQRGVERNVFAELDAITDRHLVTSQEIEEHPFYTRFLVPAGLGWLASAKVSPDPLVDVWISVQRAKAKPPFSDAELETLARLARHAEQSLRLSVRLFDAEIGKLGLGEALARVGIGVFALDSLKRIVFSNPAAAELVGEGLAIVNERLCASEPGERRAFAEALDKMIHAAPDDVGDAPKPILLRRRDGERRLAVYVLPIADRSVSDAATQFFSNTRAIILVIDPRAEQPADPTLVRDVLGLTLGEARLAALVGAGVAPKSAAEKLGISEHTARAVLKSVFAKTGVSRQSELAAMLTRLVLR